MCLAVHVQVQMLTSSDEAVQVRAQAVQIFRQYNARAQAVQLGLTAHVQVQMPTSSDEAVQVHA
jgi:hypothetical protein